MVEFNQRLSKRGALYKDLRERGRISVNLNGVIFRYYPLTKDYAVHGLSQENLDKLKHVKGLETFITSVKISESDVDSFFSEEPEVTPMTVTKPRGRAKKVE